MAVRRTKKPAKAGKKRQHPKSGMPSSSSDHAHSQDTPPTKAKAMKSSKINNNKGQEHVTSSKQDQARSAHSKQPKGRKRRGRKAPDDDSGRGLGEERDPTMDVVGASDKDGGGSGAARDGGSGCGLDDGGPPALTAVQLLIGEEEEEGVAEPMPTKSRRESVAEERRFEVERKRREKRELELQKRLEEEERRKLKVSCCCC